MTAVESSSNSHDLGDGFDLLVVHALSCTIEDDVVCAKEYGSICFGSLDEVIKVDDLGCLNEAKTRKSKAQTNCSTSQASGARSSRSTAAFQ